MLQRLLETGEFSDFVITCGDKTWKVHKAIVCSQSDVFGAATRFGKVSGLIYLHLHNYSNLYDKRKPLKAKSTYLLTKLRSWDTCYSTCTKAPTHFSTTNPNCRG
jgi:hypothetical protein